MNELDEEEVAEILRDLADEISDGNLIVKEMERQNNWIWKVNKHGIEYPDTLRGFDFTVSVEPEEINSTQR